MKLRKKYNRDFSSLAFLLVCMFLIIIGFSFISFLSYRLVPLSHVVPMMLLDVDWWMKFHCQIHFQLMRILLIFCVVQLSSQCSFVVAGSCYFCWDLLCSLDSWIWLSHFWHLVSMSLVNPIFVYGFWVFAWISSFPLFTFTSVVLLFLLAVCDEESVLISVVVCDFGINRSKSVGSIFNSTPLKMHGCILKIRFLKITEKMTPILCFEWHKSDTKILNFIFF
jgi:hypothetical protein